MQRINSYKSLSDFVKALSVVVVAQGISSCGNNFKNSDGVSGEEKVEIVSVNEDGSVEEGNFADDKYSNTLSILIEKK